MRNQIINRALELKESRDFTTLLTLEKMIGKQIAAITFEDWGGLFGQGFYAVVNLGKLKSVEPALDERGVFILNFKRKYVRKQYARRVCGWEKVEECIWPPRVEHTIKPYLPRARAEVVYFDGNYYRTHMGWCGAGERCEPCTAVRTMDVMVEFKKRNVVPDGWADPEVIRFIEVNSDRLAERFGEEILSGVNSKLFGSAIAR